MPVFGKQMKISSTKQKEIGFSFKPRNKLQQPQQRPHKQQQNDHRPTEEIQSAGSDSMPQIVINYQPHQPPRTIKFPETVYGKQKRLRHCEYFL